MISILIQALEHLCSRGYHRHAKRLEFCERCCHALGLANYHGGQRRGAGRLRRRKRFAMGCSILMRSTAFNLAALYYTKLLLILQVWRPVWFSNRRYGPGDTEGRRTDTISSAKASYHLVPLCLNFGSSVSNEWWLILCRLTCLWWSCISFSDHCRWIVGWWTNDELIWLSVYTCTHDYLSIHVHMISLQARHILSNFIVMYAYRRLRMFANELCMSGLYHIPNT